MCYLNNEQSFKTGDMIRVFNRTGRIYYVEKVTDHPDDAKVRFVCDRTGDKFECLIVNRSAFTMVSV